MKQGISIVLADDHPLVRDGLRALLDTQPDMHVVGEATDGAMACSMAKELRPDVLILDISMPGMSGIDATEEICRECPATKLLILTVHEEASFVVRLMKAGAHGYVLKRSASEGLIEAVRAIAAEGTYVDPAMSNSLVNVFLQRDDDEDKHVLSPRERDVLIGIARGYSNKEIAATLTISVKTVETYKSRLAMKAGLNSRVDIVRYAAHRGWLTAS